RAMLAGSVRFSDIASTVPGLSDRLLSERLKELCAEGLIERIADDETARVEYRLTEKGLELTPAIECLSEWAERWVPVEQEDSVPGASTTAARR
ncbi:MAG: helix-turn-helix domain-containing protein, partial [Chloroflexi bacterium]|nr:helix-turn-helix domain-containing protein [Chloroflexota bacterium]